MHFWIDDIPVIFPYSYIYPEQYAYMVALKRILDAQGHGLLEMPSGTGKTAALLSFIIAYQQTRGRCKLIYCSRTVSEINKALDELARLMAYRASALGRREDFLGLGLSARKNMCIHPRVSKYETGKGVDAGCHAMTAPWQRAKASVLKSKAPSTSDDANGIELCSFYENLEESLGKGEAMPSGVWTLDRIREFGRQSGQCPYYLVRRSMLRANVIIYSYYYLLDPKVSQLVSRELARESIVVFDEAHNIDNVCIESMSIDVTPRGLEAAGRSLERVRERVEEIAERDKRRLQDEYTRLLEGLRQQAADANPITANPILPEDALQEAVPGSIRKASHFLSFLRRLMEHFGRLLRTPHVVSESPAAFLADIKQTTFIDRKPLRMCSERLNSLTQTLEMTDVGELAALNLIADFATVVSTYSDGFLVLFEPVDDTNDTPTLHLLCLDATLAIRPVFARFQSVVITSGTLSPLAMYPQILDFNPVLAVSLPNTLFRPSVMPLIVTRGADQTPLSSRFEIRNDPAVVRNYGLLLVEMAKITPDGLVSFFPSYLYMHHIISMWHEMGIISDILAYKLLFVETPDGKETARVLEAYRRACDVGRGAVLLSVARGKVSEGIDFDNHYGRAVIMFGVPYQYTESRILKSRLEYMRERYQIRESDFLTFDALRHAAQCIGRVLRTKTDYGLMLFADRRYARSDKRRRLPRWLAERITEGNASVSTDLAVQLGKKWFREMAQPCDPKEHIGTAMWTEEDVQDKGPALINELLLNV